MLLSVFFWMLWGDLCVNIMETIIPRLVPLKLERLGAGATIIGNFANQSQMLGEQTSGEGPGPSYVERGRDAWRAYYGWLPRGRTSVSYTLRLNGAGRFSLPPTTVEAMYAPAIRAAVPNGAVEVAGR